MSCLEHKCNEAILVRLKVEWPRLSEEEKYIHLFEEIEDIIEDGCGKCFEDIIKTIVSTCVDSEEQLKTIKWLIHILSKPEEITGNDEIVTLCLGLPENPYWDDKIDPLLWLKQKEKELLSHSPSTIPIKEKIEDLNTVPKYIPKPEESIKPEIVFDIEAPESNDNDKEPIPLIEVVDDFPLELLHKELSKELISQISFEAFKKHFTIGTGRPDVPKDQLEKIRWKKKPILLAYFTELIQNSYLTGSFNTRCWMGIIQHFFDKHGTPYKYDSFRKLPTSYHKNSDSAPKEHNLIDNIIQKLDQA